MIFHLSATGPMVPPATGGANDYDAGESATFTIMLDASSTSEAAARVFPSFGALSRG